MLVDRGTRETVAVFKALGNKWKPLVRAVAGDSATRRSRIHRRDLPRRVLRRHLGWSYDHRQDRFYPEDVAKRNRLALFASEFETVELNDHDAHPVDDVRAGYEGCCTPGRALDNGSRLDGSASASPSLQPLPSPLFLSVSG